MTGNHLAQEKSAYLSTAAHQPVHWFPWGEAAFEKARAEDKPILLDIGAVWCHWCHVMDRESYESDATAALINKHFVAVKVDRDERPDVDARYQRAVSALTGQGGWPLTAFLTPDGDVFFGGTYFPPRDAHGRPGFPRLLEMVAGTYRDRRADVAHQVQHLKDAITQHVKERPVSDEAASETTLEAAAARLAGTIDMANGGWGDAPKFPHPGAMGFLLRRHARAPQDAGIATAVTLTLDALAFGGIHDHVAGGFHRYSVDARWHVPHFEKMLYDNAELLRNFTQAWQITASPLYEQTARGIVRFLMTTLAQPGGGFGASQDADIDLDDDGDHFTWTTDELAAAVPDDVTRRVLTLRFDVREQGDMHHDPSRNVLRVAAPEADMADALKLDVPAVHLRLADGLQALAAARAQRQIPFIDPSVYTSWTAMAASALFEFAGAFNDADAHAAAVAAVDRLVADAWRGDAGFAHGVTDDAAVGLLDDNAHALVALLDAFNATGQARYLDVARDTARVVVDHFWSEDARGFVDVAPGLTRGRVAPGVAEPSVQDNPSPSGGGTAALGLLRLGRLTDDDALVAAAAKAVQQAAAIAARAPVFGGRFLLACDVLLHDGPHVTIVADDADAPAWRAAALAAGDAARAVTVVAPGAVAGVPAAARDVVANVKAPAAVVCVGDRCLAPAGTPDELAVRLREARR